MRITESGLRRLIREEVRALREAGDGELPQSLPSGVTASFSAGGGPSREFKTPDELLSLLLTSGARHSRVSLLVPDPHSYSEEPDLFEVGNISFEVLGTPPAGWEDMWWWPLPAEDARPDSNSVRAPRYRSMLDAAAVSLQERAGESLHIFGFGSGAGMPVVKIRVGEVWGDGDHLPADFSLRDWWDDLVSGLRTESDPVEWGGSDTQL